MSQVERSILLALFSISSVSCNEILLMKDGIRQPGEESPATILAFMKKMGYPNENIFIFKDSSSFYTCMRDSVFIHHVFGVLLFSPGRFLIHPIDTLRNSFQGLNAINHLQGDTIYKADPTYSLQWLMHSLIPLNDSTRMDTANTDFIVVVTWATFLGRLNERLFSLGETLRGNKEVTVKLLFLCIDVQKTWKMTGKKNDIIEFE